MDPVSRLRQRGPSLLHHCHQGLTFRCFFFIELTATTRVFRFNLGNLQVAFSEVVFACPSLRMLGQ